MKYKVFFSHSERDREWVNWIVHNLSGTDISIWVSEYDVQPGQYVTAKVERNISECDCFIVLLTLSSQQSVFVQNEIGYAKKACKPIVPLAEPGIDLTKLGMLTGLEFIRFDKQQPYEALKEVADFLYRDKGVKERNRNVVIGGLIGLFLASFFGGETEN